MPPRIHVPHLSCRLQAPRRYQPQQQCLYASVASSIGSIQVTHPSGNFPATQPPSHKPPELRKSQLHRQYQSLLRSSPLLLIFQHSNIRAVELMGIRRELAYALNKVDEELIAAGRLEEALSSQIKLQMLQTGIFASALSVVSFFNPDPVAAALSPTSSTGSAAEASQFTHGLSSTAHKAAQKKKSAKHGLESLMSGPLAVVSFPAITTQHLRAVLSILAPDEKFPAPRRKVRPSYHELPVQNGLQKLLLLGARVENKAFDTVGTRWVGAIEGGLDGLRGQLVAMLQSAGASVTNTLETAGRSVYFTLEGRKTMLEEEQKPAAAASEGSEEVKPEEVKSEEVKSA